MYLSQLELWRTYWECVSRPYTVFICSLTAALCYLWGRKCQVSHCSQGWCFLHYLLIYLFIYLFINNSEVKSVAQSYFYTPKSSNDSIVIYDFHGLYIISNIILMLLVFTPQIQCNLIQISFIHHYVES